MIKLRTFFDQIENIFASKSQGGQVPPCPPPPCNRLFMYNNVDILTCLTLDTKHQYSDSHNPPLDLNF